MTFKISSLSHGKALALALLLIVGGLAVSVASFAATSSSSTITVGTFAGLAGEFGFTVSQDALASTTWSSDTATTVDVSSPTDFAVGDQILIDEDGDSDPDGDSASIFSYHTVTGVSGSTLTVSPDITNTYSGAASVSEPGVYPAVHTWTPALNSATSVVPGNHFIVNLKGLTTSDAALVEILLTNPNELTKNYTYLNRTMGVYVLCEASSSCTGDPFSASTNAGAYGDATDASGDTINATADILTIQNARQQFVLTGGYVYSVTADGGALFTIDTTGGSVGSGDSLTPSDQISITAR